MIIKRGSALNWLSAFLDDQEWVLVLPNEGPQSLRLCRSPPSTHWNLQCSSVRMHLPMAEKLRCFNMGMTFWGYFVKQWPPRPILMKFCANLLFQISEVPCLQIPKVNFTKEQANVYQKYMPRGVDCKYKWQNMKAKNCVNTKWDSPLQCLPLPWNILTNLTRFLSRNVA